jgi:hypothetical protein
MIVVEAGEVFLHDLSTGAAGKRIRKLDILLQEGISFPVRYAFVNRNLVATIIMVQEVFKRKRCHWMKVTWTRSKRDLVPWQDVKSSSPS